MPRKNERMTIRKLRNRGRTPIRYRSPSRAHHGWIVKRGRKLLHVYLIGVGKRRLTPEDQRYVVELGGAP